MDSQQPLCDKINLFQYTLPAPWSVAGAEGLHCKSWWLAGTCIMLLTPCPCRPLRMGWTISKIQLQHTFHPLTPTTTSDGGQRPSPPHHAAQGGEGTEQTTQAFILCTSEATCHLQSPRKRHGAGRRPQLQRCRHGVPPRVQPSPVSPGCWSLLTDKELPICYQQTAASLTSLGLVLTGCC